MYGKDLIRDLKSELSGNFENIVKQMFMDNALFDAHCLRSAMKGEAMLSSFPNFSACVGLSLVGNLCQL
jgi:hypothetical protein